MGVTAPESEVDVSRMQGPSRNDVVYEFNTHMALPALISGAGLRKPVVAEVANIRNIQVASGPIGHEARWIDKLTTHGYSRYYRNRLRSKTPRATIENKIDGRLAATVRANRMHSQSDRPLRIGRFRHLRNEWSPRALLSLTRSTERFHVVLVG